MGEGTESDGDETINGSTCIKLKRNVETDRTTTTPMRPVTSSATPKTSTDKHELQPSAGPSERGQNETSKYEKASTHEIASNGKAASFTVRVDTLSRKRQHGAYAYPNSPIASTPKPMKRKLNPSAAAALSPAASRADSHSTRNTTQVQGLPSLAQLVEGEEEDSEIRDALFSPHLHAARVHEFPSVAGARTNPDTSNSANNQKGETLLPSLCQLSPSEKSNEASQGSESRLNKYSLLPANSYDYEDYDTLFIAQLPPYSQALMMQPTPLTPQLPALQLDPNVTHRKTLVLDLDETLVHCSVEPVDVFDWTFVVEFNGTDYDVCVRKRPHVMDFLERVSKMYEIVVFTASQKIYAEQVLDKMDPDGRLIQHRLYRNSCLQVNGNFLKDLNVLGRDLRHTVIIDNSPHAFAYQIDNGIPIVSWFSENDDCHLMRLLPLLDSLHTPDVEDVRPILRDTFRMGDRHRDIRSMYQQRLQAQKQATERFRQAQRFRAMHLENAQHQQQILLINQQNADQGNSKTTNSSSLGENVSKPTNSSQV